MSIKKLGMPKWGLSMKEGRLLEWLVEEGAEITQGQEVAEVETEKISGAVEAQAAGVLRRRVAEENTVIPVGGLLAVIADPADSDEEIDAFVAEFQASFIPPSEEDEGGPAPETVEVDGRAIRFMIYGEGDETLVLIHGYGGDLNNWLFNAEKLAEGRTVLAVDLPGHGGSQKNVGDGGLGVLVGAVRGLLDARGVQRAHLAGHSLGALVAGQLAIETPDRVASLTLIAPGGFGEEISREYVEGFVEAGSRKQMKPVLSRLFADPSLITRQLVEDVLRYKRVDGVDASLRALLASLFPEGRQTRLLAAELGALDVPVLVLWGAEDQVIPASQAEAAPEGAEVHVLEGAGHSPHMEAAGDVNRHMERFLTTNSRRSAHAGSA